MRWEGCGRIPTNEGFVVAISELVLHEYFGPDASILVARTRRGVYRLGDLKINQWRCIGTLAILEKFIRSPGCKNISAQQDKQDVQIAEMIGLAQRRRHHGRRRLHSPSATQ
jgi:hypothetical protein